MAEELQAIDVTNLTPAEREDVGNKPMEVSVNKTSGLVTAKPIGATKLVENTALYKKYYKRYGDKVFDRNGKLLWSKIPDEEKLNVLKRLKDKSSLKWKLRAFGVDVVTALKGKPLANAQSIKGETKDRLEAIMDKFLHPPKKVQRSRQTPPITVQNKRIPTEATKKTKTIVPKRRIKPINKTDNIVI